MHGNMPVCTHLPPEVPYIAIVPDDMFAVQELHMATETFTNMWYLKQLSK